MKLSFQYAYKSIRSFSEIELPNFSVVTGINGAGKTQLLEALADGAILIDGVRNDMFAKRIKLFNASSIMPLETNHYSEQQAREERNGQWENFSGIQKQQIQSLDRNIARWPSISQLQIADILKLKACDMEAHGIAPEQSEAIYAQLQDFLANASSQFEDQFRALSKNYNDRLTTKLKESNNTPLIAYNKELFFNNYPPAWREYDLFQYSLSQVFIEYQAKWRQNEYRTYQNKIRGKEVHFYEVDEFHQRFGTPPWDVVNEILMTAGLSFTIDHPPEDEYEPYEPTLTDKQTRNIVKFSDLSSGERILMAFALLLYNTRSNPGPKHPIVLLFDEIDAPLHPSMTRSLMSVIRTALVDKRGIKVILTTHSPSTVALAGEDTIFTMIKEAPERLKKTSKDAALSLLMSGVPSLSIYYENRRQVFVESDNDVRFYDLLLKKVKTKLEPEISISFIACGSDKNGGCDKVKTIVKGLVDAGNDTVRGLIDWDRKNRSTSSIIVLGESQRYNIENHILDPLIMGIFLLQEKIISREDLGLHDHETHIDIRNFENARLQVITNYVVSRLKDAIPDPLNETVECAYCGGQTVRAPTSILRYSGHDLETVFKDTFPELKSYRRSNGLKMAVLTKTLDDLPEFIPECVLIAFRQLQANLRP